MLKIVRVDTLDSHTLELELEDGSAILFNISSLMDGEPEFAVLRDPVRFLKPETDGIWVFWRGGPRLSLEMILDILGDGSGTVGEGGI